MKVCLIVDDMDHHGEGCDCGLCNSNGKSYGVGIFPKKATRTATEASDPLDRVYGPSEDAALSNARQVCKDNGWTPV